MRGIVVQTAWIVETTIHVLSPISYHVGESVSHPLVILHKIFISIKPCV